MINLLHVLTWAALVVACWFLISARRLHHQVRRQLKELETRPVPLTNVRVVQPDRSEDPVELVYQGAGVDGLVADEGVRLASGEDAGDGQHEHREQARDDQRHHVRHPVDEAEQEDRERPLTGIRETYRCRRRTHRQVEQHAERQDRGTL